MSEHEPATKTGGKFLMSLNEIGLSVPNMMAIASIAFASYVWMDDRFDALEHAVRDNTNGILRNRIDPAHTWRRGDQSLWCARFEAANQKLKVICPDPYKQPAVQIPSRPRRR